ncbi:MAG: hypothetical protein PQJ58_01135 [Spirochaetales bacterium]|nr:hypothetical protein [Spirochaetales bacterium]
MVRIAKNTDPKKLRELKSKINETDYLDIAIRRIALTLTNEIVHMNEDKSGIKFQ